MRDLVQRKFRAQTPGEVWVAAIPYIPTDAGCLYLAVMLDVFGRRAAA